MPTPSLLPIPLRLLIRHGVTFTQVLRWGDASGPVDLSGWEAKLVARRFHGAETVLLETSTADGGIALGADGTVTIVLDAPDTYLIPATRRGVYELRLEDPGGVSVLFAAGEIVVRPTVIDQELP